MKRVMFRVIESIIVGAALSGMKKIKAPDVAS